MTSFSRHTPIFIEYEDVLKNIEAAVLRFYAKRPDLTDGQVDRVYELLSRATRAGARGGAAPPLHTLGDTERELYERIEAVCAWHMGKRDAPWKGAKRVEAIRTAEEIITCLKHLRKSVQFWTKESGRQGYLNYVKPYVE